jgi:glycosyltransferase involved in cell wall biosynthesis
LTSVPPNAAEIEAAGAGKVVEDAPEAFAAAIETLLGEEVRWSSASVAARELATAYDWNAILPQALGRLGFG